MNDENIMIENNEIDGVVEPVQKINPWINIWTRPRETMRFIINENPNQKIIILAILYGIINFLDRASSKSMGDSFSFMSILIMALCIGSIGGICYVYINAFLLNWTGKWIGGKGSTEQIRAAIVWGAIPYLFVSILWIPELFLYGQEMFTSVTPRMDASIFLSLLLMVMGVIELIGGICSVIVTLKCLGEVQGFSTWKALGNSILSGLIIFVPFITIILIFVVIGRLG